ncbi:unnamed protein product [Gadus morhua 'NCC']
MVDSKGRCYLETFNELSDTINETYGSLFKLFSVTGHLLVKIKPSLYKDACIAIQPIPDGLMCSQPQRPLAVGHQSC